MSEDPTADEIVAEALSEIGELIAAANKAPLTEDEEAVMADAACAILVTKYHQLGLVSKEEATKWAEDEHVTVSIDFEPGKHLKIACKFTDDGDEPRAVHINLSTPRPF